MVGFNGWFVLLSRIRRVSRTELSQGRLQPRGTNRPRTASWRQRSGFVVRFDWAGPLNLESSRVHSASRAGGLRVQI